MSRDTGVRELLAEFETELKDCRAGERLRDGVHCAIVGAPNAGREKALYVGQV